MIKLNELSLKEIYLIMSLAKRLPFCTCCRVLTIVFNRIRLSASWHRIYAQFGRTWWRHQMETFSAWLALCAGNSPVTGEFSAQRPVTRSFDVSSDLRVNKRLYKQSCGWWFETPTSLLWRHRNAISNHLVLVWLTCTHHRIFSLEIMFHKIGDKIPNSKWVICNNIWVIIIIRANEQ